MLSFKLFSTSTFALTLSLAINLGDGTHTRKTNEEEHASVFGPHLQNYEYEFYTMAYNRNNQPEKNSIALDDNLTPELGVQGESRQLQIILGVVSNLLTLYQFIMQLIGGSGPTLDNVMTTMQSQFADVHNELQQLYGTMEQFQIQQYQYVEEAVTKGIEDAQAKSRINTLCNAMDLYDKLQFFLLGMLGQNVIAADILAAASGVSNCGSNSTYDIINKLMIMVDHGVAGLTYYSSVINDTTQFNGLLHVSVLDGLRQQVITRLQGWMTGNCTSMNPNDVNNYIAPVLGVSQFMTAPQVAQALYARLCDIYYFKANPLVYVANTNSFSRRTSQSISYWGNGTTGSITNGIWKVFWILHPLDSKTDSQHMSVNDGLIYQGFQGLAKKQYQGDATYLSNFLLNTLKVSTVTFGRPSTSLLVFLNGDSSASIGIPPVRDAYMGSWSVPGTSFGTGMMMPFVWFIQVVLF